MNKRFEWLILILLALGGVFLWWRYELPRFGVIDLSISQSQAIGIAKRFMKTGRGVDPGQYHMAVRFYADEATDRFLQKTLGTTESQRLIKSLNYDLFWWSVRFFKEKQKEEYKVSISSANGKVIGFSHIIEDTAFRPYIDKDKARQMAFNFLKMNYGFDASDFVVRGEQTQKYDNRQDYTFTWDKKGILIPWSKKDKGSAKVYTTATVSGNEITGFGRNGFDVPDGFNRYVENLKETGQDLIMVFRILYLALITIAIVVVVNRKHQVVSRSVKSFYIGIGMAMFVLMVMDVLNGYQDLLFDYPTTQSLNNYLVRVFIENVIAPFFVAVGFVLPALAGESLRFEVMPQAKNQSFLSPLMSSFLTVNIARQIFAAYLAAAVILGAQAYIFNLGFKYCGVWDELAWLAQASTSVVPAFTALVIGFQASFSEESMFRLFAINFFKKYGVPTFLAVFFSAAMWGFGHTGYEIYPMWFRGIEVTCIGIIMGIFYLRYGLMCVIAAHYLIDSFLSNIPYLLHPRPSFDFYSSVLIVTIPMFFGIAALVKNRSSEEKPLKARFNAQQEFNYNLLLQIYRSKAPEELTAFKKELVRHGWDAAIIQRVFEG